MPGSIANETELIQTYLAPLTAGAPGALGLRDDAAFFTPPPGTDVVVTTDPILAGVHFLAEERADDIAWKALAVNVSDLAAKGATPVAYTMALAFPQAPAHAWMEQFAAGLAAAQNAFGCTLIGGDTDRTSGPLSISITAFGVVPRGLMVQRNTASIGDDVFVTGTLGDAALGLVLHQRPALMAKALTSGDAGFLKARYLRPEPRLALAPVLLHFASAALDVSDGLVKDLGRLVAGAGGRIDVAFGALPLSKSAQAVMHSDPAWAWAVLSGGDDYEIACAVAPGRREEFVEACSHAGVQATAIGRIVPGNGVCVTAADGQPMDVTATGWDHFA